MGDSKDKEAPAPAAGAARSPTSPQEHPYSIRLIVHPAPVRVSYATVATLVPDLISHHDPDFILHIGVAGGRDHYSLETRGHRDGYRIKDVDEHDGWKEGEQQWKNEGVPAMLRVGWDEDDVLTRWEKAVKRGMEEGGFSGEENKKRGQVRLSRDAGRFLCEFALMESLSRRWVDAEQAENEDSQTQNEDSQKRKAMERVGKVAFLHVPGWTGLEDVRRGVMVAEAAIRSLVESWEDGLRRKESEVVDVSKPVDTGRWEGVVWKA